MKHNNTKARTEASKPTHTLSPRLINIIFTIVIALVGYWLLAIDGGNFVRKIDSHSLFLPTHDYFMDCMRLPGGLLTWASTFLTQTFYYPWLGATVYVALLLAIVWCAIKAFRLPHFSLPALTVIPAAILLAFVNIGYVLFSLKTPGFAFLLPIGTLCCVLAFWAYRLIPLWWVRAIVAVLIPMAGYGCFGFYALLTTAMCIVYEAFIVTTKSQAWWRSAIIMVAGAAAIYFMPIYWVNHVDSDLSMTFIYRCPLPRFFEGEDSLWIPYIVTFAVMLILSALAGIKNMHTVKATNTKVLSMSTIGILAVAAIFVYRYTDSNFRLSIDLDRAIWEEDWQKANDLMASFTEEPTRLNVILNNIALIRSGKAADEMFKYPNGSAPYTTARSMRVPHDASSMLFSYHTGLINYAYRWTMEYKVEYGMTVEQLKLMTKCALLNGDYEVARKCLDNLALTPFHKAWADRYYKYVDNPSLIADDPEMGSIKPLMWDKNEFIEDKGTLEGYIWSNLANVEQGGEELLYLSLIGALISRQIDSFAERVPFYARLNPELPRYFQEAVLIWSRVHNHDGFRRYKISQEIKDNFVKFLKMQEQFSDRTLQEQEELMRPTFGDTYWFYAIYMRDMQII